MNTETGGHGNQYAGLKIFCVGGLALSGHRNAHKLGGFRKGIFERIWWDKDDPVLVCVEVIAPCAAIMIVLAFALLFIGRIVFRLAVRGNRLEFDCEGFHGVAFLVVMLRCKAA